MTRAAHRFVRRESPLPGPDPFARSGRQWARMAGYSPRASFDRPAPGPLDPGIARATSGNPAQHFGGRRLLAPRAVDRSHLVGLEQPSPGTSPLSDAPRRCRKHRHVGSRTGGKLGRGACLSACAGCRGLRSRDRRCRAPFDVWATIGTPSVVSRSARDCPGAEGTASALVEEGRLLEPRTVLTQEWSRERSSVTFRGDVPGQRRAADSPCGSS